LKIECDMKDLFEVTSTKLQNGGLLLTSVGRDGRHNVMTIGWGLMGTLWRKPVFMVAVRPSRHTHGLIEETDEFTVNVPADGMDEILAYCGKVSGRDCDKFKEMGLAVEKGRRVKSPIIPSCVAHFECKVIGKSKVVPELLSGEVQETCYPSGNYHTLYFGEILAVYGSKKT